VPTKLYLLELFVRHFDSSLIVIRVQHCFDFESRACLGATDQIYDRLIVEQRLSFQFRLMNENSRCSILFTCWFPRVVTDGDRYLDLISHLLQVELPQAKSISLLPPASAQISNRRAAGYVFSPVQFPPSADAFHANSAVSW